MPSVLTHINLANDILRLHSNLDKYKFIIGTIMPDCIDFSDNKEYRSSHYIGEGENIDHLSYLKSGLIENCNYSYHMGYHLHLWFDEKNKTSDISELIKSKIKSEEQVGIIKQEISIADLSTFEGIDFDKLREICVSEFSTKLVKKVDEITKQIENIKHLTNEFKYLDSDRYLNYIKNLALKYAGKYL